MSTLSLTHTAVESFCNHTNKHSQALSQTILSRMHFSTSFYSAPHSSVRCYTRNSANDQEMLVCTHTPSTFSSMFHASSNMNYILLSRSSSLLTFLFPSSYVNNTRPPSDSVRPPGLFLTSPIFLNTQGVCCTNAYISLNRILSKNQIFLFGHEKGYLPTLTLIFLHFCL